LFNEGCQSLGLLVMYAKHSECIDFGDKYMTNNELIYHYKSC
jgi:hypothetical protein